MIVLREIMLVKTPRAVDVAIVEELRGVSGPLAVVDIETVGRLSVQSSEVLNPVSGPLPLKMVNGDEVVGERT